MKTKIALALVIMICVGMLGVRIRIPAAEAAAVPYTLYGSAGLTETPPVGWSLVSGNETVPGPTLSTVVGDNITLLLISDDNVTHQFFVDYDNNGFVDDEEPVSNEFLTNTTLSFVPDLDGNFTYRDAIYPNQMYGTISVEVIPEYSSLLFLPLLVVGSLLVIVIFKKRHR